MNFLILEITPSIAAELLKYNTGNRAVRRQNVSYWKSALLGGAVSLTHQGIAITGTMQNPVRLIDGQHRLTAILECGISATMVVCENFPEESFKNLDNGMTRSLGDRAGVTSEEAQMSSCFYYLSQSGRTSRPNVKLIREIHEEINPFASMVPSRKKRHLSLVSIRAAFVVQQKLEGRNHASEFQGGQFEALPPSLNALYRKQSIRAIGGHGGGSQAAAFCMAHRAILSPSSERIRLSPNPVQEAAEAINAAFPEIHKIIEQYAPTQSPEKKEGQP